MGLDLYVVKGDEKFFAEPMSSYFGFHEFRKEWAELLSFDLDNMQGFGGEKTARTQYNSEKRISAIDATVQNRILSAMAWFRRSSANNWRILIWNEGRPNHGHSSRRSCRALRSRDRFTSPVDDCRYSFSLAVEQMRPTRFVAI